MTTREARLSLGAAAVLSVTEAARLLPGRESECRKWLRTEGLVRFVMGRPVVIWGDVVEALRLSEKPKRKKKPTPLRRGGLKVAG